MTPAQLLKAYGHLTSIGMADIQRAYVDPSEFQHVLANRRCAHPDFVDEELAQANASDVADKLGMEEEEAGELVVMHSRMEKATGRGSFPPGCVAGEGIHTVGFYVNYNSFPAHYTRDVTDDELDRLVDAKVWGSLDQITDRYAGMSMLKVAISLGIRTYLRQGVKMVEVGSDDDDHEIHVLARRIAGSTIGYAYYNDESCTDHVTCNLDSTYRPGLHSCTGLLSHEWGHNHNLPHEFAGQNRHHAILSYAPKYPYVGFSTGEAPYDRPKDPSISRLVRYYGGEPIPENGGTPPPVGQWPSIVGKITTRVLSDGTIIITGHPVLQDIQGQDWPYLIERVPGTNEYRFTPDYLG